MCEFRLELFRLVAPWCPDNDAAPLIPVLCTATALMIGLWAVMFTNRIARKPLPPSARSVRRSTAILDRDGAESPWEQRTDLRAGATDPST
jgi:hypothetical protein